jgi:hypothetical protein
VQGSTRGCFTESAGAKVAVTKGSGQKWHDHLTASAHTCNCHSCTACANCCSPLCCVQVDCEPDYEPCSGTVCRIDEFCAGGRSCRPNNCKERQQYACPTDTSPLRSVTCINATFTDCYSSQHFNCSIGTGAALISCGLNPQASSSAELATWLVGNKVRVAQCVSISAGGAGHLCYDNLLQALHVQHTVTAEQAYRTATECVRRLPVWSFWQSAAQLRLHASQQTSTRPTARAH